MRYDRAPQRRRAIAWFWHEGLASAADGPRPCHTHTHTSTVWVRASDGRRRAAKRPLWPKTPSPLHLSTPTQPVCATPPKHTEGTTQLWDSIVCLASCLVSKCVGKTSSTKNQNSSLILFTIHFQLFAYKEVYFYAFGKHFYPKQPCYESNPWHWIC